MWIPWTCHRLTGVERDCKSCRLCRKDEKGCWINAVGKPIQDSCHGFKTICHWTFKFQSISVNAYESPSLKRLFSWGRGHTSSNANHFSAGKGASSTTSEAAGGCGRSSRIPTSHGCIWLQHPGTMVRMRFVTCYLKWKLWNWNDLEWY